MEADPEDRMEKVLDACVRTCRSRKRHSPFDETRGLGYMPEVVEHWMKTEEKRKVEEENEKVEKEIGDAV